MIDHELKYCPRCRDEYVIEATRCAACRCDLVVGLELLSMEKERESRRSLRVGYIEQGDDVVAIHKDSMAEVKRFEAILAKERIAVVLTGDEKSCGGKCCPSNFFINVRREDAADASAILRQELDRASKLDDHDMTHAENVFNPQAGEVQCPACGTVFVPNSTECPDCGLCF